MKTIALALVVVAFASSAFAQTASPDPKPTCKSQATDKKLAGAALTSFMKKCETDAGTACDTATARQEARRCRENELYKEVRNRRDRRLAPFARSSRQLARRAPSSSRSDLRRKKSAPTPALFAEYRRLELKQLIGNLEVYCAKWEVHASTAFTYGGLSEELSAQRCFKPNAFPGLRCLVYNSQNLHFQRYERGHLSAFGVSQQP